MRCVTLACLALCLASLTGCFHSESIVFINPDGSGRVEMTTLLTDDTIEMMGAMSQGMDEMAGEGSDPSEPPPSGFSMLELQEGAEKAAKMGSGVTFVKTERIKAEGMQGIKAVYSFEDITQVKMDMEPESPDPMAGAPEETSAEPMFFGFDKKKGHSVLTIRMPSDDEEDADPPDFSADEGEGDMVEPEMGDEQLDMFRSMFENMRVHIAVEVVGKLVETNSLFVEGNRVTILDLDFGALMEDPVRLRQIVNMGEPESLAEATQLMKDIPGLKINPTEELTIEFKGK